MEGKSLSKKAIVAIVIIAILVVAAISMVVVFLKDQGETEATAIGENNSNSEQTQDAVPENNGDNNEEQIYNRNPTNNINYSSCIFYNQ